MGYLSFKYGSGGAVQLRYCGPMFAAPILLLALAPQPAPPPPPFVARCAACHGDDGRGTARGPGLVMNPRVAAQPVEQLRAYLERGNPGAGMPAFAELPADDLMTQPVIPTRPGSAICAP
jgi:cytochrome c553